MIQKHVIRAADVSPYSPSNHVGTANQRIIGPETVGARLLEVLIGTISKGGGGLPHAHPALEQAGIILAGSARSEVDGVVRDLQAGDFDFIPSGLFHAAAVTSDEPLRLIVIYAPPYGENTAARILPDPLQPVEGLSHRHRPAPTLDRPVFAPADHQGTFHRPVITHATVGARHMEVFEATFEPGKGALNQSHPEHEQALLVRQGGLAGLIGGAAFEAFEGDWIFIPKGASHEYAATGPGRAHAILIRATASPAPAAPSGNAPH